MLNESERYRVTTRGLEVGRSGLGIFAAIKMIFVVNSQATPP